ncbi:hypothetical protein [Nostoc sp.]|uniref:hypothetical protein n=1 Tax=Nostoc sp. TaxID=1180 RepID=UPI002FF6C23C
MQKQTRRSPHRNFQNISSSEGEVKAIALNPSVLTYNPLSTSCFLPPTSAFN